MALAEVTFQFWLSQAGLPSSRTSTESRRAIPTRVPFNALTVLLVAMKPSAPRHTYFEEDTLLDSIPLDEDGILDSFEQGGHQSVEKLPDADFFNSACRGQGQDGDINPSASRPPQCSRVRACTAFQDVCDESNMQKAAAVAVAAPPAKQ